MVKDNNKNKNNKNNSSNSLVFGGQKRLQHNYFMSLSKPNQVFCSYLEVMKVIDFCFRL